MHCSIYAQAVSCRAYKPRGLKQLVFLVSLPWDHPEITIEESTDTPSHVWNANSISLFQEFDEYENVVENRPSHQQQPQQQPPQQHMIIPTPSIIPPCLSGLCMHDLSIDCYFLFYVIDIFLKIFTKNIYQQSHQ